jgi:hypothetical protein
MPKPNVASGGFCSTTTIQRAPALHQQGEQESGWSGPDNAYAQFVCH